MSTPTPTTVARAFAPGALIDSEILPAEFWPEHARIAYRVHYQGVGYDGTGREVSGSVFLPKCDAPPQGWPVVSYAHGTTGLSDEGAPSRAGLTRPESAHVARWLAEGWVVAATDYEGLATPGPHPYLNGEAVADDVVDIVRAARRLGHPVSRSWVVTGFSQGGHAALFVGLIADKYAPELDFLGTVALAPPVHLPLLMSVLTADREAAVSVFTAFVLAGLRTSNPDFDARPFLTEDGVRLVDLATTSSFLDMFRAVALFTNGDTGTTHLATNPSLGLTFDACRVPAARMTRPVLITAGTADNVVPVEVVEKFVHDIREAGTDVHYVRHEDAGHAALLAAGHAEVIAWARALLAPAVPAMRSPVEPFTDATPRFSVIDATGDGYLTRDDYEVFALRLTQAFGEPPGSTKASAVREGYRKLWKAVAARSDTDGDGRVSEAEFVAWIDSDGSRHDGFDQDLAPLARAVVALADNDADGTLSRGELTRLLLGCDLSTTDAEKVYDALDSDGGGTVSVDEIIAAIHDFCLDPGPGKPGHWLFGRF